ncbi:hypothetical protein M885DRAFT_522170 [Pelagophyceae sp. CCMP2097]|nr:hypothetical protein M885DRAFT_522170 [Pelagophyceae sp. CCMP2097]
MAAFRGALRALLLLGPGATAWARGTAAGPRAGRSLAAASAAATEAAAASAATTEAAAASAAAEARCGAVDCGAVDVYDGVFSASDCSVLHAEALHLAGKVGTVPPWRDGSCVFRRGEPTLALERAVDSFLDAVGDASPFVEWWWRTDWRPVSAHVDVDEEAAKLGTLKSPRQAHVLYLKVGDQVRGPTVVFATDSPAGVANGVSRLVSVPPVEGRVLRFDGDLLHAVPRPAAAWAADARNAQPEALTPDAYTRSVLLFNTWAAPPLDVPLSSAAFDAANGSILARPRGDWRLCAPQSVDGAAAMVQVRLAVPMLGACALRRGRAPVMLLDSPAGVLEALASESNVFDVDVRAVDFAQSASDRSSGGAPLEAH